MKLNGIGKAGIILLFINSGISIFFSIVLLIAGLSVLGMGMGEGSILTIFSIFSIVLPVITIIFGALAITKKSNGMKIACGVLGLISIVFVWVMYIFPAILALVGGILTLCGKIEGQNNDPQSIQIPEPNQNISQ